MNFLDLLQGQDFPEELQSLPNRTYLSGPDPLRIPPSGPDSDDFDLILTRFGFRVRIGSKSGQNRVRIRSWGECSRGSGPERYRSSWEGSVAPRKVLIAGKTCGILFRPAKIKYIGSTFSGKFSGHFPCGQLHSSKKNSLVQSSFCRCATLKHTPKYHFHCCCAARTEKYLPPRPPREQETFFLSEGNSGSTPAVDMEMLEKLAKPYLP